MIRDRDRNEMELQQLRVVVNALDGGLRRFASGGLTTGIDTPFPIQWEGMRRDFNRGLSGLNGAIDSVLGGARLLREDSASLRDSLTDAGRKDREHTDHLSRTTADSRALAQGFETLKAGSRHAAIIADRAREDLRRPKEAVAAALDVISRMEKRPDQRSQGAELGELSATTAQIGRELEALGLYLESLGDHLAALMQNADDHAGAAASHCETLAEMTRSRHGARLKGDIAALLLDRMDRQIADIDHKASRFTPVTVITEPPHDPSPADPGGRASHLRLVKS